MRVSHILTETTRTPVSVVFDLVIGDTTDYHPTTISGYVTCTPDDFGTGDSPTGYEFVPTEAVDTVTNQRVPYTSFSDSDWDWIDNEAIDQAKRSI